MSEIRPHWNCNQHLNGEVYYRIPGRDYDRGEVTHKTPSQMNRKERRAMATVKRSQ